MKKTGLIRIIIAAFFVVSLTSCTVRTYKVIKQRPDQNLLSGNKGVLFGSVPETDPNRSTLREVIVMEVEVGDRILPWIEIKEKNVQYSSDLKVSRVESQKQYPSVLDKKTFEGDIEIMKYTVQKNDTLDKISARPEVYGTAKKWKLIYEANKDKLKSPDKIYPGQVLDIPRE